MACRFRGLRIVGLVTLLGLTAAGVPSQAWPSPSTTTAQSPRRPSIAIVLPKAGSTVHGRSIRVSVAVRGFNPEHEQFRPRAAGEGHVHFYLDVAKLPKTHVYPSPVPYRSISGTTYTWTGVGPGRHTVAVQLVGNDHVPLRPQVTDRATFTVH